jgi:Fe2+ transport system protein FeoA
LNCKLTDIKKNQSGIINNVIDNPLISKLFEFGLLPGASFKVLNIAPFNGPISILIEDTRIALRRKEAQFIIVDC